MIPFGNDRRYVMFTKDMNSSAAELKSDDETSISSASIATKRSHNIKAEESSVTTSVTLDSNTSSTARTPAQRMVKIKRLLGLNEHKVYWVHVVIVPDSLNSHTNFRLRNPMKH